MIWRLMLVTTDVLWCGAPCLYTKCVVSDIEAFLYGIVDITHHHRIGSEEQIVQSPFIVEAYSKRNHQNSIVCQYQGATSCLPPDRHSAELRPDPCSGWMGLDRSGVKKDECGLSAAKAEKKTVLRAMKVLKSQSSPAIHLSLGALVSKYWVDLSREEERTIGAGSRLCARKNTGLPS